jgi:dTDP-4-amino-4,6-dideoxygalactose transaminase
MHRDVRSDVLDAVADLVDSGTFINGPQVAEFERQFATYCKMQYCVGVASGLDALRLALIACEVGPDDEVVVPAHTFIATFAAVTQAGGLPVVVDISEADYNMDVLAARDAITARTRVLLPVHLYGQMADVEALREIAASKSMLVVEDACQAHGSTRNGLRAGTIGVAAAFSFYPSKNLGAFGDAGAVVTGDPELASRIRSLREHGQTTKYHHEAIGWTARLDTLHALALLHKLPLLDSWNAARREAARHYSDALEGVGDLVLPPVAPGSEPVWHLYVVRTKTRDALREFLAARGIGTGQHYPELPHLSSAYRSLGYGTGSFPVAEALAGEGLSLPLFPGMSEAQLESVVGGITQFFRRDS